jgi:TPR repeat protein
VILRTGIAKTAVGPSANPGKNCFFMFNEVVIFEYLNMNTLLDITNKYDITFSEEYSEHEREIVDIFNGKINDETTNDIVLNCVGLYHRYVTSNYELAVKYFLMAIEKGNADAINNLGWYYAKIEKNYEFAVKYYLMAIEKGNVNSMYNLGWYYDDIEKNYDLAVKYYLLAIEKGNAKAMNNLGWYYAKIEKNYELAIKYYLMAIEKCNVKAMDNLGRYYAKIEKNYELAIKYYLMAIEKGNKKAMNNLGHYYENVEKHYDLAVKYYLMAIEKGNVVAMNNLGWYYAKIEKNYELAVKYYLMAIEKGNKKAIYNLAMYYDNVEKNYKLAAKYYMMAIKNDNGIPNLNTLITKCIMLMYDKTHDDGLTELFLRCYDKHKDICETEINQLPHNAKLNILSLLGRVCECTKCIEFENKKANLARLDTCGICLRENLQCIPFNNLDICPHVTCVDCYIVLKGNNSKCPFCRQ